MFSWRHVISRRAQLFQSSASFHRHAQTEPEYDPPASIPRFALAIQSKNATLSTLIEISYPIFIILLGWILFKQNHLTPSVLIGGGLIFTGIAVIYAFNK
jgi:hypothetical protein